jgi:sec-independent protein translocase protein TatA
MEGRRSIFMFGMGAQELIIIFAIVFFIFGAKRLPEMGKGIGQAIRGFKTAMTERPQIEQSHEMNNPESMTKK